MQIKIIIRVGLVTAFVLSVPFVAMLFTDQVIWNLGDFVIAGVLLISSGLALDFTVKKLTNPPVRAITGVAIVAVLLLIWAELAVGIAGTPFAGS